jgi:amino acid transporter
LAVNEESIDMKHTPGRAALLSTVVLLFTYVLVTVAVLAFRGSDRTQGDLGDGAVSSDMLLVVGTVVLQGGFWAKLLILSTMTSAVASIQTTIIATTRATLSMARAGALPGVLARIHPRHKTPTVATVAAGVLSVLYFAGLSAISTDILADSVSSITLMIAFYYAVTAFACAWRFRIESKRNPADFIRRGLLPMLGGVFLSVALVKSGVDMSGIGYGRTSMGGVGGVFWLAVGPLVLGALIVAICRRFAQDYFSGRTLAYRKADMDGRSAVNKLAA